MNGASSELRDLKPWEPYEPPGQGWNAGAGGVVAVLILLGAASALWRRLRAPSPERAAAGALAALATEDLPDAAWYRRLTTALRALLEARFALPSATLAQPELAERLAALPLPEELARGLADLLRCAEEAVFGGRPVEPSRRAEHLSLVRQLLRLPPPRRKPVAPV